MLNEKADINGYEIINFNPNIIVTRTILTTFLWPQSDKFSTVSTLEDWHRFKYLKS